MAASKKPAKANFKFKDLRSKKSPRGGGITIPNYSDVKIIRPPVTSGGTPTGGTSSGGSTGGWDLSQSKVT
jgi:hypothetical protein